MMKYIFGIYFLLISLLGHTQAENAMVKTLNGKKYYVHSVEKGNTLYGIHKLYKTDLNKILNANPGLTDNLAIGQQVLIPIDIVDANHDKIHVVKEGETVYGISKKYNCTVSELKNNNPGIADGIRIGQELKILQLDVVGEVIQDDSMENVKEYQISYSDSIVYHTILPHETLYSISKRYMVSMDTLKSLNDLNGSKVKKGNVLKIPIKRVNYAILEKKIVSLVQDTLVQESSGIRKETYSVALLLPFMLAQNDILMGKPVKFGQIREMHLTTKIAFEFYQGFKLAADSVRKAGMNLRLFVYDSMRDTANIEKILNGEEFKEMDIVIGPLYKKTVAYTVKQCAKRKIRIVLPFKTDPAVLHDNPFVFKAVSSNMTLIDGTIDYVLHNHSHHNVMILKPYLEGDKALYERAKAHFNTGFMDVKRYNAAIVELGLGSSDGRDLNAYIKKDTVNIVIVPSNDVRFITGAMNRLNKVMNMNPYAKKLKIIVFGFEDWNKYSGIDVLQRNRLNQHYSTYRFVDYNRGDGLEFVKAFRSKTGIDPSVYASQGFDVGMYFLSALFVNGTNFENSIAGHHMDLVQNKFEFKSIALGSGFENMCVSVVRYQGFELIPCAN